MISFRIIPGSPPQIEIFLIADQYSDRWTISHAREVARHLLELAEEAESRTEQAPQGANLTLLPSAAS
jgi:hypothetical protein